MLDGTTHWQPGDCVLVEAGPTTLSMKVRYDLQMIRDREERNKYEKAAFAFENGNDAAGRPRDGKGPKPAFFPLELTNKAARL